MSNDEFASVVNSCLEKTVVPVLLRLEKALAQSHQEWLSIKQAAEVTNLSSDHVRRAILGGTLPASNIGSPDRPLYRISRKDLTAWMDERKAGPKPAPRRRGKTEALPDAWLLSPHRRQTTAA